MVLPQIHGTSADETVGFNWSGSIDADDSKDFYIEVRYIRGAATGDSYKLSVYFREILN